MQLPADLRERIEHLLGGEDRKKLATAANDISLKYRRENGADLQIASEGEAKAYIATRMPATWCAVYEVLSRLLELAPDFSPSSSLDLGAGPGTATLAARHIWPQLSSALIEPNAYLRNIGSELVDGDWKDERLETWRGGEVADLIISSYVFNEVGGGFSLLLDRIWSNAAQAFVMIEPGTPQGYQIILEARAYFLSIGANIAAPCPHSYTCPLQNSDRWCHFSSRVDRSRIHLQIKPDARLSYEDEKFSYLVVTRFPLPKPRFRVLGEPHGQKLISLETCCDNGSFDIQPVSKRSELFKKFKKMKWGDMDAS